MSAATKKKTKNRKIKKNEEESLKGIKVKIVGVGGGGGSIISNISPDLKKVSFAAVNTDLRALKEATKNKKVKGVSFGKNLTSGLGTGMDKNLGRRAAEEDIDEIQKLFKDQDIVIFVASLGGGTGSGAMPTFAKAAKEMGALTYGLFTLPFPFEGDKKMKIAKEAVKETKDNLDAVTILPNEKIFEIVDKNTPLKEALSVMNDNLAKGLEGLIETIFETGLINVDFADIRAILKNKNQNRKFAYLSTAEGKLEEGAKEIVKRVLTNPLYAYSISRAKGMIFNITGGSDIGLTDISSISESISKYTEDDAKIIIGIMQKKKYKDKVKVALFVTGCYTDYMKKEFEEEGEISEKKDMKEMKKKTQKKKKRNNKKIKSKNKKEEEKREEISEIRVKPIELEKEHNKSQDFSTQKNEEKRLIEEDDEWDKPAFLK